MKNKKITLKLTVPQQRAVARLSYTAWQTAYCIGVSVATLKALVRKGMVKYRTKQEMFYKLKRA